MTSRRTTITATIGVIALVVALVFIIRGCGAGDKSTVADSVLTTEESAHKILTEPAVFDGRTLDEYAEAIQNNATSFTVEDNSLMIVGVEAALNRICQELEQLNAGDDAADAWNVLTEAANETWSPSMKIIVPYLNTVAHLTPEQSQRVAKISETITHADNLVAEIEKNLLHGRSTGLKLAPQQ